MDVSLVDDDDDDVQIIKVVPTKKSMTWVSSSFDDFKFEPLHPPKSYTVPKTGVKSIQQERRGTSGSQSTISKFMSDIRSLKRPREYDNSTKMPRSSQRDQATKAAPNSELWLDKCKPLSRAELAVHKKKVEVIVDWLSQNSQHVTKHKAPILLLTGPPGAGKTACIHIVCAELGIDMHEWSSTSEQAADQWSEGDFTSGAEKSKVDVYTSQSQSSLFHNFLLRANKYRALDLFGPSVSSNKHSSLTLRCNDNELKSAIVVEDIPNIFYRETQKFHDILRNYRYSGHCPLVFIMTESNSNSSSIHKLFPKDLQLQLHITNISLNPVPPTVLIKLLNGVASREARQGKFSLPSASVVEAIALSSGGDIRFAINTLQFACRSDTADLKALFPANLTDKKKKKGSVSRLKSESSCGSNRDNSQSDDARSLLGVKDTSIFLFHAVGKILYFKRGNPKDYPKHQTLAEHLKEHNRDPLLCDPEDVAEKSQISGDYFNSFLHENYVDFIASVEALERATQYFSDADCLSALWTAREELQNFSVSVATRGYIHSNSEFCRHDSTRKMGWRPLHRSQWFNVNKQAGENVTTARQLFKGYHWEPEVLCTEIMPYISLTNPTLHDPGQISFIQEMTQFSQTQALSRSRQERLDEKDVVADDEKDTDVKTNTESQSVPPSAAETDNTTRACVTFNEEELEEIIPNSQTKVQDLNCENEIVIEDYDD